LEKVFGLEIYILFLIKRAVKIIMSSCLISKYFCKKKSKNNGVLAKILRTF